MFTDLPDPAPIQLPHCLCFLTTFFSSLSYLEKIVCCKAKSDMHTKRRKVKSAMSMGHTWFLHFLLLFLQSFKYTPTWVPFILPQCPSLNLTIWFSLSNHPVGCSFAISTNLFMSFNIYLCEKHSDGKDNEDVSPPSASLPRRLQQPGLEVAEVRSLQLPPSPPWDSKSLNSQAIIFCYPRGISMTLYWKWRTWDWGQNSDLIWDGSVPHGLLCSVTTIAHIPTYLKQLFFFLDVLF